MYEFSLIFLNIIMVITTIWTVNKYLNIFLERKEKNVISMLLWVVYFIFLFYVQCNVGQASGWIPILGIMIVSIITFYNFYGNVKKLFLIIFIYYAIGTLIEILLFLLLKLFHMEGMEIYTIGQVLTKIIMIIVVYIISNIWRNNEISYVPTSIYCFLFVVPIGSIYIAIQTFFLIRKNDSLVAAMIIFSILLSFNVVIFELYSKIIQFFTLERENAVYVQQINIVSKNTELQKRIMEDFHKEKHDLVNELIILKHNVECKDMATALSSLNQIIHTYDYKEDISMCGNTIIDAIINFKYALAKEKKIKFILKLFIPEELPFDQCDLGIVVGNALDNAIEAVDQCKNQDKQINIAMGLKKEAFVMAIKNPYENNIKKNHNGDLLSTKSDYDRHGYGVRSIQRVIEKYNGVLVVETDNNEFSLVVTMNF